MCFRNVPEAWGHTACAALIVRVFCSTPWTCISKFVGFVCTHPKNPVFWAGPFLWLVVMATVVDRQVKLNQSAMIATTKQCNHSRRADWLVMIGHLENVMWLQRDTQSVSWLMVALHSHIKDADGLFLWNKLIYIGLDYMFYSEATSVTFRQYIWRWSKLNNKYSKAFLSELMVYWEMTNNLRNTLKYLC